MPRDRPATTGYERLAQADQLSDDSDDDFMVQSYASLQPASAPRFAPISQPRPHSGMTSPKATSSSRPGRRRRVRTNSGVDLKAINARLERWADEIAARFKRGKKKTGEEERLEIHHSVFQAPEGVRPATAETLAAPQPGVMTRDEFEAIVNSVRLAIEQGVHPRMISQGSSGSYFARNPEGKVVGVFKPKDEEPYAAGNPKWNKWIHRNLFPCCFGRACLIPNLSYVSEAAAYVLDVQLRTHMVPYTDVVYLSSKSFHYPFWDRYNYSRNRKPLPSKPGSFQVFLKGFKDANVFLREHPWPDQYLSGFRTNETHRKKKKRWADNCRPSSARSQDDTGSDDGYDTPETRVPSPGNFVWTEGLKQSFREELEKLVILDYIMRNTDRGLDNWMIKVDWESQDVSIVSEPVQLNTNTADEQEGPRPVDLSQRKTNDRASYPYRKQKPMEAASPGEGPPDPKMTIGAIDNSLSWPWKHPDAWRSFPFGWLFLPVDLIGRPFSQKTRDHFLPLLTSTQWWSQTQLALRRIFQCDPDFQEKMFARQIAVMKGQAWNVVETLKTPDHGPLELTRRAKVCVWDDLVEIPVAVPMRVTSAEMRRRTQADFQKGIEEEMDIGAANPSSEPVDLLGLASPPADLPHPGRFEIAGVGESPGEEMASPGEEAVSPLDTAASSPTQHLYGSGRQSWDDGDDVEGDLGYAAAEGMEGNQRKVIVERLEAVKARNPVFTCW
ncbi:putative phosphatidylinositol 4-kinase type ii subunit alpha protein [Phaeoacremonium minimum UCRPA7]|uniref:Phosphatidylinositol 4-kinase n=1 Tax=Phaeoacremonium minimum (strain UCR-PA7) TaxID=1286976 RepID=R8BBB0_PHAM7|nr:putative phosphatidylinositol 4-kinase type ii subunit alpha protein [Phaeoacremonium minimum UCRPA7]EON96585.1 putative phosphatidylinositol 4-kinase type ii subunit alpha protein [Phaeoacremonium minimum UCRPA7]